MSKTLPDLKSELAETAKQLRPVSADANRAIRDYGQAIREHDELISELAILWAEDGRFLEKADGLDRMYAALDRARQAQRRLQEIKPAYETLRMAVYEQFRVALSRSMMDMPGPAAGEVDLADSLLMDLPD